MKDTRHVKKRGTEGTSRTSYARDGGGMDLLPVYHVSKTESLGTQATAGRKNVQSAGESLLCGDS